jgi:hypothetical protein
MASILLGTLGIIMPINKETTMFNIDTLKSNFDARIATLEGAENIVREQLRDLSRDVLFALHLHENIVYVNRLLQAKMTVMNRKTMLLFLQEFTGFQYSEKEMSFTKKDKKTFDEKKAKAIAALDDPMFNFWTWADRNVVPEVKAFDPAKVTKYIGSAFKKAEESGFTKADVIIALFKDGMFQQELTSVLRGMGQPVDEVVMPVVE